MYHQYLNNAAFPRSLSVVPVCMCHEASFISPSGASEKRNCGDHITLYSFLWAAVANDYKLGFKQKCILPSLWRPEVWNQGLSMAGFTVETLGKNPFLPSLLLASPEAPWLEAASLQSAFVFTRPSLLCFSPLCVFYKEFVFGFRDHQESPGWSKILSYICKTFFPNRMFVGSKG